MTAEGEAIVAVIDKYFGRLENYGLASEEPAADLLWNCTAFPVCDAETLDRQLAEFIEACERCESICCLCGRHYRVKDGMIETEEECPQCRRHKPWEPTMADHVLVLVWQLIAWRLLRRRGDPPRRIQRAFDRTSVPMLRRS